LPVAVVVVVKVVFAAWTLNAPASNSRPAMWVNGFIFMWSYGFCLAVLMIQNQVQSPRKTQEFAEARQFTTLGHYADGVMTAAGARHLLVLTTHVQMTAKQCQKK
jgi:hypothetical protein